MPKTRRFRKRRRTKGKKLATVSFVKSAITKHSESKFWDRNFVTVPTVLGVIDRMSSIPQNTTDLGRIGDKLEFTRIEIRYRFNTAIAITACLRLIIFQWYPNTSLTVTLVPPPPVPDNILQGIVNDPINTPYFNDYLNQYRVLYDRRFSIVPGTETQEFVIPMKVIKGYKKILSQFAAGVEGSNHIYSLQLVSNAASAINTALYSRIRFSDS